MYVCVSLCLISADTGKVSKHHYLLILSAGCQISFAHAQSMSILEVYSYHEVGLCGEVARSFSSLELGNPEPILSSDSCSSLTALGPNVGFSVSLALCFSFSD